MIEYEIWTEPYLASGMEIPSRPALVGKREATSFEEACIQYCSNDKIQKGWGQFNPTKLTLWGLRLYPSYDEAENANTLWETYRKRLNE